MVPYKKLALAVTVSGLLAATGTAQAALVSYNTTLNLSGTGRSADGSGQDTFAAGSIYGNAGNPAYTGTLPASWYASLNAADSALLKSSNLPSSVNMGGPSAPALTTAGKSYQDAGTSSNPASFYTNWSHNADFGLFHLNAAADLTITVSADGSQLSPGFSVWQGWDTNSSSSRHSAWVANGAPKLSAGAPGVDGSSLGTFEGTAWTATSGGSATLTLNNLSAGDYSLILGGFSDKTCTGTAGSSCTFVGGLGGANAKYQISFAASPVPLPAAVWLFGSALMGFLGLQKRKMAA